ncbi:MAG: hypothetical protein IPI90_10620 [Saprospiraceae bacterium]|nr:hypothetical protein [Candidatus Vicinibacter affinis]
MSSPPKLAREVSFLNKGVLSRPWNHLYENSKLLIDASRYFYIDHDVLRLIREFGDISSRKVCRIGFKV